MCSSDLFAKETRLHPATLRNMVTSPGGTTTEALLELQRGGVPATVIDAVTAAYQKSLALGREQH